MNTTEEGKRNPLSESQRCSPPPGGGGVASLPLSESQRCSPPPGGGGVASLPIKEELLVVAKSVLLDFKPIKWDSVGWAHFNATVKPLSLPPEEVLGAWRAAIDLQHKAFTYRYRVYASSEGIHAAFDPDEEANRKQDAYAAAMSKWEDIRLKKIERVGDILRFFTENNCLFQMSVPDVYSQASFRKAYSLGTSIILPAIDPPSYDKFILSFKITVIENVGASLREKIEEVLALQYEKFKDALLETPKDAKEAAYARGWAVFGFEIFFKSEKLLRELRKSSPGLSMELMVSSLRDSGAILCRERRFNYWKYVLGENIAGEPI